MACCLGGMDVVVSYSLGKGAFITASGTFIWHTYVYNGASDSWDHCVVAEPMAVSVCLSD